MKILTAKQVRELDSYTIEHEPISSLNLMERAARVFANWFSSHFPDRKQLVSIFCGPGNNGGDGLAITRLLSQDHYEVKAFLVRGSGRLSTDCQANYDRLKKERSCPVELLNEASAFPMLRKGSFLIDALFGSGLSRPLDGFWEKLVAHLNQQEVLRISVDLPSGMFPDEPTPGASVQAHHTFSFEMPKLGFVFPENAERVGDWNFGSIGLHPGFIKSERTPYYLMDRPMLLPRLRQRKKYDHKGSFGHALLVAGGYGKVGAAILAARAVLRSGAGLVTVHAPKCAYQILQVAFPEAMVSVDEHKFAISSLNEDFGQFNAVGVGCGIGTNDLTAAALRQILEKARTPLVLDADALNLLAKHPDLMKKIPARSILTPHPKEFERMFGVSENSFDRNFHQRKKAKELGVFIVLKGAHTAVASPYGNCYFNSTGNPGMATGGTGDVLTGMLTGLLAQGYPPLDACLLGVYLHGLAGDLARFDLEQEALLASDVIAHIGKAFMKLRGDV